MHPQTTMAPKYAVPGLHPVPPCGSLKGYVETTFSHLIEVLGEPHVINGDKTTVEWSFGDDSGVCFTIYDWKLQSTPKGFYRWHIGGNSTKSLQLAMETLGTGRVDSAENPVAESRVRIDIAHLILSAALKIHEEIKDDQGFAGYEGSLENVKQLSDELYELYCNNKNIRSHIDLMSAWFEKQGVAEK
jgi:hypothetical protein